MQTLMDNFLESEEMNKKENFVKIIGESKVMMDLFSQVKSVAPTNASVLLVGESGTGKELFARDLFSKSPRFNGPFITIDCVSLPNTLFESELFGHEKGSFTGAFRQKIGLFEQANGGTIFLDEITELDISMQAKLLRVLETRKLRRIGGTNTIDLDIRIISATNRNPSEAVSNNRLREDLFFRLNVIQLRLPPLRNRGNDINALASFFLSHYNEVYGKKIKQFSPKAKRKLKEYEWPGNIRELKNLVEQSVVLANGSSEICLDDLPPHISTSRTHGKNGSTIEDNLSYDKISRRRKMRELDQRFLKELIEKNNGNISKAAKNAGLHRTTLYRILNASKN